MTTRATSVQHPGVSHEGCNYFAPVFHIDGCGDFWMCEKCGQGDEMVTVMCDACRPPLSDRGSEHG